MLTKAQKTFMYVTCVLTIIVGIVTCVPFRTLSWITGNANWATIEQLIKFVLFPVIILALVIFPNTLKQEQINNGPERSVTSNVFSVLPILVYIASVLALMLETFSFKLYPMGSVAHGVLLAISAVYLVFTVVMMFFINKFTMQLSKKGNGVVKAVALVLLVLFAVFGYLVLHTYSKTYDAESGYVYGTSNNDPFLFVSYIVLFFAVVVYFYRTFKLIRRDEVMIYAHELTEAEKSEMSAVQCENAYNDILDDFEDYYDTLVEQEIAEATKSNEPVQENEEVQENDEVSENDEVQENEEVAPEETPAEVEKFEDDFEDDFVDDYEEPAEEAAEAFEEPKEEEKNVVVFEDDTETPLEQEAAEEEATDEVKLEEEYDEIKAKKVQSLQDLEELNKLLIETDKVNDEKTLAEVEVLKQKIEDEQKALEEERNELEAMRQRYQEQIAQLQAQVDEINGSAVEEEPEEVVEVKKKTFKPTFEQIVTYTNSLQEEDWKVTDNFNQETGTGTIKYYKGKVPFLVLQATTSDYRITFLTTEKKWNPIFTSGGKTMSIPKNMKGNKWLKFVNKGVAPAGTVKGYIREAVKGALEETNLIAQAKEEEKARKAEERKAAREAQKAAKAEEAAAANNESAE